MIKYEVHVYDDGDKYWYLNGQGQLHRTDGPAVEYVDGSKYWYLNGQLHRTDGPAVEWADGTKFWYLNDREYTEAEWLKALNPTKELTVAEVSKLLGYEVKIVK